MDIYRQVKNNWKIQGPRPSGKQRGPDKINGTEAKVGIPGGPEADL